MKGFTPSKKSFGFPTSADSVHKATTPSRGQQIVRPHLRSKPAVGMAQSKAHQNKFASGGPVSMSDGNTLVQRSKPVTQFDADDGGKTGLRTGYAKGGKACDPKGSAARAVAKHVATPAPRRHKGAPPPLGMRK